MASEFRKQPQRKKKLPWKDDRSTNKYYGSNQDSAIQGQHTVADSPLKPGQKPVGKKTKLPSKDDRSADKNYRAAALAPTVQQLQQQLRKGQNAPQLLGQPKAKQPARKAANAEASMLVSNRGEINGVVQEAVTRLQNGDKNVVIFIQQGNSQLLRATRAALDILVTRQVITEGQHRDVRLSYALGDQEREDLETKLQAPMPMPTAAVRVEDNEAVSDEELDALLGGKTLTEDGPSTAPTETVEVDTTNDVQDSPAPSYPAPAEAEEDEDNDFLSPKGEQPRTDPYQGTAMAHDELDRSVDTDKPVRVVDKEDNDEAKAQTEIAITEPQANPEHAGLTSHIETPSESMEGIGNKPKKPGRRGGRGAN